MGASTFMSVGSGVNAKAAFDTARGLLLDLYNREGVECDGYAGSIIEKETFIEIPVPKGQEPSDFALELISNDDSRIVNKYGPAGCVTDGKGNYIFFGWASE